ncbi:hypothetical protein BDB00DRAFT_815281 [Zychaea mexicana]|uniref:uncharacterized protein n=1 Tax=Zychaea mexicana TaxID=64656 RepID=UPI0022FE3B9C|nr:uncharacterized protein BDB00DRAFT_815281 [Zychaea mexicana]KAI9495251.1 hypothetical protein BDB00DRAFT_815281 [Zychaea mexicana]
MLFHGTFVHTPKRGELVILTDTLLAVDETTGRIATLLPGIPRTQLEATIQTTQLQQHTLTLLSPTQFILPGFIDTHIHAPQITYAGTGTDVPLMVWLNLYAFPAEKKFKDVEWARYVYPKLVDRLLRNGTTTALYFGSLHLEANKVLANTTLNAGQRAFIGKVCIDQNSPDDYIESTENAVRDTEAFIQYCLSLGQRKEEGLLLTPVVTPRFLPTCSIPLLEQLGQLAKRYDVPIQSHISESLDEVAFVQQLYGSEISDTEIFDKTGLLTPRTVMAHGVHLNYQDTQTLAQRGTAVAVCPLSNAYFANGVFPSTRFSYIKQGLGTDIGGGYAPSMLSSIRHLITASRYLASTAAAAAAALHGAGADAGVDNSNNHAGVTAAAAAAADLEKGDIIMDWRTGLYMATRGGAECLQIQDQVGSFQVGMSFDAILVDVAVSGTPIDLFPGNDDRLEDYVEKFINLGDDRNITNVWVNGQNVLSLSR